MTLTLFHLREGHAVFTPVLFTFSKTHLKS